MRQKWWELGCVNPASWLSLAAGGQFTQPRTHLLSECCRAELSCRVCEPTELHHSITVVNLPLLLLIKIFEGNKIYNESLIPELNDATGDSGGFFGDSLIQRVSVSCVISITNSTDDMAFKRIRPGCVNHAFWLPMATVEAFTVRN